MRILIIEDNRDLAEGLRYHLSNAGYEANVCFDGEEGLYYAGHEEQDLILLDRILPGLDGVSVLKQLRAKHIATPVLIITALDGIGDRVTGLDAGADDYLVKPIAMEEMLARVRALLRRPQRIESDGLVPCGDLMLDAVRHFLQSGKSSCALTKRECDLLALFMRNEGQTLKRNVILERVWGNEASTEGGNLDNYIYFLRKRIKSIKSEVAIVTVRGVGYRLEAL